MQVELSYLFYRFSLNWRTFYRICLYHWKFLNVFIIWFHLETSDDTDIYYETPVHQVKIKAIRNKHILLTKVIKIWLYESIYIKKNRASKLTSYFTKNVCVCVCDLKNIFMMSFSSPRWDLPEFSLKGFPLCFGRFENPFW